MNYIFEYGEWMTVKNPDALKHLLRDIWEQRLFGSNQFELKDGELEKSYQPFVQFDGYDIRANNFVGFIQHDDEVIEIYPKVFRNSRCSDRLLMLQHIFFWFNYCRKWKFPFNEAILDNNRIDKFPELIIYLIANKIFELISTQPLMQYQQVEDSLTIPRGSVNFSRYINKSLSTSNFHRIECDYEPFLYDNKVNRIIKYCLRVLVSQSCLSENVHLLQESINILDEVEDNTCSVADIDSVSVNNFFQEYITLLETCKWVINQQLYSNSAHPHNQWCLLFPMEYIFEDFIAGFLEKHFSDKWIVKYQKSDQYLSNTPQAFNMQHDIFLTSREDVKRHIIVDTKYKIRDIAFKSDIKKGISQTDLYQMVSYAFKRGCKEVLLIYPNISEELNEPDIFKIKSGFDEDVLVNVTAIEVPFWSAVNFSLLEDNLMACLKRYL